MRANRLRPGSRSVAAPREIRGGERAPPHRRFGPRVRGTRIRDSHRRTAVSGGSVHRLDIVEHGASLAILATPDPHRLVLVRQYRHAAGAALWELPAGTAEPDEDPRTGALRELREETGYRAGSIRPLGALYTTPGFCDEILYFFHAEDLEPGEQALDEDERIDVAAFSAEEAWRLVVSRGNRRLQDRPGTALAGERAR